MPSNDPLFDLIKSLSPSEKRYLSLHTGYSDDSKKKGYLLLFELLDKMDHWDKESFQSKVAATPGLKNLSAEKRYLTKSILRNLRHYHEDSTLECQVHQLLDEDEICKNKVLNHLRLKCLNKARSLCRDFELYEDYLKVLKRLIAFHREYPGNHSFEQLEQLFQEEEEVLAQLRKSKLLKKKTTQMFLLMAAVGNSRDEEIVHRAERIMDDPVLKGDAPAGSFFMKLHYFETHSNFNRIKGEMEKWYDCNDRIRQLWQDHPRFIKAFPVNYTIYLSNYLVCANITGKEDHFHEVLETLKKMDFSEKDHLGEFYQNIDFIELLHYGKHNAWKKADQLIEKLEKRLILYKNKVHTGRKQAIYINVALIYFRQERFTLCLDWVLRIIEDKSPYRKDIQVFAKLLQIICHFELQNKLLAENLILALRKELIRKSRLHTFEKKTLSILRKLVRSLNKTEEAAVFQELLQLTGRYDGKTDQNRIPGLTEIEIWSKSRLEQKHMSKY